MRHSQSGALGRREGEEAMSTEILSLTDKQLALETVRQMPETATLQEISEEMAILAALRRGEADANAGGVLSHEEAARRSAEWISR
jgi:predicted transcriptional regulator